MFAGFSCYKKSGHHDLYNFRLLCHNARMSTLCRAERKWQVECIWPQRAHGAQSRKKVFSFVFFVFFVVKNVFSQGGRRISDNPKNFGNISGKQPFSEIISDYFFWGSATVPVAVRRAPPRTSGQRCVWQDARHRARDARAPSQTNVQDVKSS